MGEAPTHESGGDRERRVEELFHLAVVQPVDERDAFVARHCADDPELGRRLRQLLAQDERGTQGVLAQGLFPRTESTDETIGRYRLLEVLGEGGMGTVHLAEQLEPVRRRVALKTIRPGLHSEAVAARFGEESQALALMSHPGIAKIFDGGLTDRGLPYFVMEYVPGLPLTEYCDRHKLAIPERVKLFVSICEAVQHAHQKGIVHRDLKPGNVLVMEREGSHQAKVIDFGIARAVSGPLVREGPELLSDRPVGTHLYMSPEQADPRGRPLDTRADIYSLGATLYELFCGTTSISPTLLADDGLAAVKAAILEEIPPPPSARLGGRGEEVDRIAARRGVDRRELRRQLTGDLDWITMRALEKEPVRRYASASELGADLTRYLADEPVAAAPASTFYRFRKAFRRNQIAMTAGVLLVLSLAGGITATTAALRRARAAEETAGRRLDEAAYQAEKSSAFVDFLFYAMLHADPGGTSDMTLERMFELSRPDIGTLFSGSARAEASVRSVLGRAYLYLGEDELAREELLHAFALQSNLPELQDHPDLFQTLVDLAQTERRLGGLESAEATAANSMELALKVVRARRPELEGAVETMLALAAGGEVSTGEALERLDELLDAIPGEARADWEGMVLGRLILEVGTALRMRDRPEAAAYLERLEEHAREIIPPDHVSLLRFLWVMAGIYAQPGNADYARVERYAVELIDKSTRLPVGHWVRLDARRLLALAHAGQGRFAAAEAELLAVEAQGHAGVTSTPRLRAALEGLGQLSELIEDAEDPDAVLDASWQRARENGSWWVVTRPGLDRTTVKLAVSRLQLDGEDPLARVNAGFGLVRLGRYAQALATLEGAQETPTVLAFRALALAQLGQDQEARATLGRLWERNTKEDVPPEARTAVVEAERALR